MNIKLYIALEIFDIENVTFYFVRHRRNTVRSIYKDQKINSI